MDQEKYLSTGPIHLNDATPPRPRDTRLLRAIIAGTAILCVISLNFFDPRDLVHGFRHSLHSVCRGGRRHGHHRGQQLSAETGCPAQGPALNVGGVDWDWKPMDDAEYVKMAVKKFQGAIQIPTVSYDDMGTPGSEPRFKGVVELQEYLVQEYPLVHETLTLEKVAVHGLLYTWQGKDASLKPVVLMAHQDVVPVNPETLDQWTQPPFSGFQDEEGWIWGVSLLDLSSLSSPRNAQLTNCPSSHSVVQPIARTLHVSTLAVPPSPNLKLTPFFSSPLLSSPLQLIGILAAIEQLASEGFAPTRTIILSFGFDEEIGGSRSAKPLAEFLLARYGANGISLLVDEGFTGVDRAYGTLFARLGMAEKGAFSLKLEVFTPGGHSSVPRGAHTAIGVMSRLLVELESHPAEPNLREGHPMLSYLDCARIYGDMDKETKRKIRNPKRWKELGIELAGHDDITAAFLQTTQAIDLITGGIKINALPEAVTASINYRIDVLDSIDSTFNRIVSILTPVVSSYNMTFSIQGTHASVTNDLVRLTIIPGSEIEPAPKTPSVGPAFELMSGSIKHVFTEEAIVAPSMMIANTDTKWYWELTHHIYRFVSASLELIKAFHTVDERIHVDAHLTGIQFFHKLLRNTEGWVAE